jgi:hypothetical protein
MLRDLPFARSGWRGLWPVPELADRRYVIVVEEKVRQELDARHITYTELPRLPRFDLPTSLQAFRISGFNTGNMRPVTVTVISNQRPHPAASKPAGRAAGTPPP